MHKCIPATLRRRRDGDGEKVELGERMALQVFAATTATESGRDDSQTMICSWRRDLAEQDSRVGRAEKELHSIVSMAKSKLEGEHDAARSGEPWGDREVRQGTHEVHRRTHACTPGVRSAARACLQ